MLITGFWKADTVEIEAKYAIAGPLTVGDVATLDLSPYTLRADVDRVQRDVVLDTADRALISSRHALRIRRIGDQAILTFKGPGRINGHIRQREELEAVLAADVAADDTYTYTRWPAEIADRVEALAGGEQLAPLLELRVRRRTWLVERDGQTLAELAFDDGTIHANGKSQAVRELELELMPGGTLADLHEVDARLRAALPLEPELRGKLQRGLTLLGIHKQPTGHTPLRLACGYTLKRAVKRLRQAEAAVRSGEDPEAVHDMRVAIRRLRSGLQVLEEMPGFDCDEAAKQRRRLREPARALGAVRDLDVALERLEAHIHEHQRDADGLAPLLQELRGRHAEARARLVETLDRPGTRRHVEQLDKWLRHAAEREQRPPTGGGPPLVRHAAGSAIWRRYEEVLRFEGELADESPETLHQLRIAGKRLRYALEMFEPFLGPGARPLIATLVDGQDCLGRLHDVVVGQALAEEQERRQPGNGALARYRQALEAERAELHERFEPIWLHISGHPFRQALATVIAGL